MLTYNFGTTYDVKQRLSSIEEIPDTLEMPKFAEAIAPLIRGTRTIDQVRDAFAEAEKELGTVLLYLTRYHIIEALCDDNEIVRMVSLNQDFIADEEPGAPHPFSIEKGLMLIFITCYLIAAVSATATLFFPVDQVLAVVYPVVYTLAVFYIVFLLPLWMLVTLAHNLYGIFMDLSASALSTAGQFIRPDDDRQMLKLLGKRDSRTADREAKYRQWAEQYKVNRIAFMQKRLATTYAVLSPVILVCFALTMLTTRSQGSLWMLPMLITLAIGFMPFVIVRATERKLVSKYLTVA